MKTIEIRLITVWFLGARSVDVLGNLANLTSIRIKWIQAWTLTIIQRMCLLQGPTRNSDFSMLTMSLIIQSWLKMKKEKFTNKTNLSLWALSLVVLLNFKDSKIARIMLIISWIRLEALSPQLVLKIQRISRMFLIISILSKKMILLLKMMKQLICCRNKIKCFRHHQNLQWRRD